MSRIIRMATEADSEAILKIYAPYITGTAITFETEIPSVSDFTARIVAIMKRYPFLVCENDGEIVGYSYASRHRERAAYLYDVDTTICLNPEYHGSGAADKLYNCLLQILEKLGDYNAYAAYVIPNEKSARFHEKHKFIPVGTYPRTGYKRGRWHDLVWVWRTIKEHVDRPERVKSVSELTPEYLEGIFACSSSS